MAGRFTTSKIRSLNNGRIGKYLLYALGEIILVVVGILIALNINNRNEQKKEEKILSAILSNVKYDLEQDTLVLNQAIKNYSDRKIVLDQITRDTYTKEDYQRCLFCPGLITSYYPFSINDKGYLQLKSLKQSTTVKQNSLTADIVQFYNYNSTYLDQIGGEVKTNSIENIKHWMNNYPWFSKTMNNRLDPRFTDYMIQDPDFKNRATYYNSLVSGNYLPFLMKYKLEATEILNKIEARTSVSN